MQIFRRSDASPLAEWWRTVDKGLIAAILMLLAAGLVLSLAAGPAAANRLGYDDPFYFVYRQAAFAIAAAVVLFASSLFDEMWARRVCAVLFVICFVMMALLLLIGHEAKGATALDPHRRVDLPAVGDHQAGADRAVGLAAGAARQVSGGPMGADRVRVLCGDGRACCCCSPMSGRRRC